MRLNISLGGKPANALSGHALSEYGLAIGLVVIVSIAALTTLGSQVSGMFENTIGTRKVVSASTNPLTSNSGTPVTQAKGFFLTPQEIDTILNQAPTQTLSLGNGKSITIPNPNYSQLSETLGPNGVTEVSLAMIKKMQEALRSVGIDPETEYPELSFYAKNAHKNSHLQKKIEQDIATMLLSQNDFGMISQDDYLASFDSGDNGGHITQTSQIQFHRDEQGHYYAQNFYNTKTGFQAEPINIETLPLQTQLHLSHALVATKLISSSLWEPFQQINNNILTGTRRLAQEGSSIRFNENAFKNQIPTWLNTKIEANKACLMSQEQRCFE